MSASVGLVLVTVVVACSGLLPLGRASCPNITSRRSWGARAPVTVEYIAFPVEYVVVGHTASPACTTLASCARQVTGIQQQHISLAYDDIGYGFLIGGDAGVIFEGRGWHKRGAHTVGYNKRSIGVAFIGDYDENAAPEPQLAALRALLDCGRELGELQRDVKLIAQRQVANTVSPGLALYQQLQSLPEWQETV